LSHGPSTRQRRSRIAARQRIAAVVVGEAEALHSAGAAGRDTGQASGGGIKTVGGDEAIAKRLLHKAQLGIAGVGGPIGLPGRIIEQLAGIATRLR
jgi:hypothetical protein